jgi:hypothetical protein
VTDKADLTALKGAKRSGAVVVPETVEPAEYDCARVMVVLGSERFIKLSQVVAFAA